MQVCDYATAAVGCAAVLLNTRAQRPSFVVMLLWAVRLRAMGSEEVWLWAVGCVVVLLCGCVAVRL